MTRIMSAAWRSIRAKWTSVHSSVVLVTSAGLLSLCLLGFPPARKAGVTPLILCLLFLVVTIGVLYLVSLYLLAYTSRREQELEQIRAQQENMRANNPEQRIFKGFLWSVELNGDDIEVVSKFLYTWRQRGKLSEVKRLEFYTRNYKSDIYLIFHDSKWNRPDKEIPIALGGLSFPVILDMMITIKAKAVNAKVSPKYLETIENGKGIR